MRSAPPRRRSRIPCRVAAIVTYTTSGSTALRVARERPEVPILASTASLSTARALSLAWGAHCVLTADLKRFSEMVDKACRIALQQEMRQGRRPPGDHRRRALRHARLDQHPARRLGRGIAAGVPKVAVFNDTRPMRPAEVHRPMRLHFGRGYWQRWIAERRARIGDTGVARYPRRQVHRHHRECHQLAFAPVRRPHR